MHERARFDAVVLDMDGLMLDTETIYKATWQATSLELGYDLDDATFATFSGRPTADCERALLDTFGRAFPLAEFRMRWPGRWRDTALNGGVHRKAGLDELLAFIERHSLPTAVATSTARQLAEFTLDCAGLRSHFTCIVTGDQVKNGKPAPDIYLEAVRRLGVEARRAVAIEDSSAGTISASRAGLTPLMIPDWTTPTEAAVCAAYRVLPSLHEARLLLGELFGLPVES